MKSGYLVRINLFSLCFILCFSSFIEAKTPPAEYLYDYGIAFYNMGRYDEALTEFYKVLLLEPNNEKAKFYINAIFANKLAPAPARAVSNIEEDDLVVRESRIKDALNAELVSTPPVSGESVPVESAAPAVQPETLPPVLKTESRKKEPDVTISGKLQLGVGVTSSGEVEWNRANFDWNEKNWRILSYDGFNNGINTYDTRIFDRLELILDSRKKEEGWSFHLNLTVDPWSFTGRTNKVTIPGVGGDAAEVELKYWANSGYTVNTSINTLYNGDAFSIPELKVKDGKTVPTTITSTWTNRFTIPEMKIEYTFQPVRELWFDYVNGENTRFRAFPLAYQDQALTSDDPLQLSNHHIWWEASPWISRWQPGNLNSGASPVDFTKGYWDNSLASYTRDSNGSPLTGLRGFSFTHQDPEATSIALTMASPKDLWQEYSEADNVSSALRLKQRVFDNLSLGTTYTFRAGFNYVDKDHSLDSANHVIGVDSDIQLKDGLKVSLQAATSRSDYDRTGGDYRSEMEGDAYYFSLISRYPGKDLMGLKNGYNEISKAQDEDLMFKTKIYGARMDKDFDTALASYRQTRKDAFWSRHLHFRRPFQYYYTGLYSTSLSWDDIKSYAIGDGIDAGRQVLGFRAELFWGDRLSNLFDVRNVHNTDNKFLENAFRDELTWQATDKLTTKALVIYQHMPDTTKGVDPYVYNSRTGRYLLNNQIEGGEDPSLKTGSLGAEYAFTDWLAVNGVWERTNDYTLAYDNFPQGILNDGNRSYLYYDDERLYRDFQNWLYDQQLFQQPPYPFYNIFKTGLRFNPAENMEIYLDYTRNQYGIAGPISSDMNHVGLEFAYLPWKKLGFYTRYVYSRWKDLDRLRQGISKTVGHHNFFSEVRYMNSSVDELVLQFGECGRTVLASIVFDPYGGSLSALDTQHIVRLFYRRKF
ncbi:MAG: tetratricopeptide repeat protein [Candidatus Omnitrophica bacterium]|nr:tetratricopeptide repeat protein [Candidatus Omnitrophota bacterium]